MARFSVLGFTEAELGFVLAALFVAISGYQIVEASRADEETQDAVLELDAARDSIARLTEDRHALSDSVASLEQRVLVAEEELERMMRLRSGFTPACSERDGIDDDLIAEIGILGSETFELGGERMGISGVLNRLSPYLRTAEERQCRFYVRLVSAPDLLGTEKESAEDLLRPHFYFGR